MITTSHDFQERQNNVCMALEKRMNTLLEEYLQREATDLWGVKKKLADAVGVKGPSVDGWFNGKTKTIKSEYLFDVARFFGVYAEWIVNGTGAKYPHHNGDAEPEPTTNTPLPTRGRALVVQMDKLMPDQFAEIERKVNEYASQNEAIFKHLQKQQNTPLPINTNDFAGRSPNTRTKKSEV